MSGFTDYLGAADLNVTNRRGRLSFTSSWDLDNAPSYMFSQAAVNNQSGATGSLEGTVRVAGIKVGEVGVYPNEDDKNSTDYVAVDPRRFEGFVGQTVDVTVDGQKVGTVDIHGPGGHDPTRRSDGSDLSVPDDSPEEDPADLPGLVSDSDAPGDVALAPGVEETEQTRDYLDEVRSRVPEQIGDVPASDLVDVDPPALDVGNSSSAGGSGSGVIGAVGAGILLVLAAAAALLAGGEN